MAADSSRRGAGARTLRLHRPKIAAAAKIVGAKPRLRPVQSTVTTSPNCSLELVLATTIIPIIISSLPTIVLVATPRRIPLGSLSWCNRRVIATTAALVVVSPLLLPNNSRKEKERKMEKKLW